MEPMQIETDVWYRYEDVTYAAPLNEYDEPVGPGETRVHLREFTVLKHTPKGVQLDVYGQRKFVLKDATKRYACPTKEEASDSFLARKRRQLAILKSQQDRVERAIKYHIPPKGLST